MEDENVKLVQRQQRQKKFHLLLNWRRIAFLKNKILKLP